MPSAGESTQDHKSLLGKQIYYETLLTRDPRTLTGFFYRDKNLFLWKDVYANTRGSFIYNSYRPEKSY